MSCKLVGLAVAVMTVFMTVLGFVPRQACAQDDPVDKMTELNRRALAAFEAKNFEGARDTLLEAVVVGKEARLDQHKMMARTYLHLGALYVEGLRDRSKGVRYLALAVRIRPDIQITPSLLSPTLSAAFDEAKSENFAPAPAPAPPPAAPAAPVRAPPPPPPAAPKAPVAAPTPPKPKPPARRAGPDEPDLPANIPDPLHCPNPSEAPPNRQIALRCVAQPGLPVARVILFYRLPGDETVSAVPAVRSPKSWYNAVVPASASGGKQLHYYFEARNASDATIASNGRSDSPTLMLIRAGAEPVGTGVLAVLRQQKLGGEAVAIAENPLDELEREKERAVTEARIHRRPAGSLWLGLGVGTGFGWHTSRSKLEFRDNVGVDAGTGMSGLLQLSPEVGYQWTENVSVSLQTRHQYIPETGSGDTRHPGSPAHGANAVLLKATYYLSFDNVQMYVSGAVGGGEGFRIVIPPKPSPDPMLDLPRNDTVRGGPVLLGPGGGFMYHFTRHMAVNVELRTLLGLPTLGFVADVLGGVQVAF